VARDAAAAEVTADVDRLQTALDAANTKAAGMQRAFSVQEQEVQEVGPYTRALLVYFSASLEQFCH